MWKIPKQECKHILTLKFSEEKKRRNEFVPGRHSHRSHISKNKSLNLIFSIDKHTLHLQKEQGVDCKWRKEFGQIKLKECSDLVKTGNEEELEIQVLLPTTPDSLCGWTSHVSLIQNCTSLWFWGQKPALGSEQGLSFTSIPVGVQNAAVTPCPGFS